MIVQWCIKGMSLPGDHEARQIIDTREGIVCNWWRRVGTISPSEKRRKLNHYNLDMHVNHFMAIDPGTGRPFSEDSPFISLSAGTVERDAVAKTNYVHRARKTALFFGTEFGQRTSAYLYTCWVILAPRPSAEIEAVAEEVRDLNSYRRYSPFQTEGEVLAKVIVADNHIQCCEKWEMRPGDNFFRRVWSHANPRFTPPQQLANVRELI